MKEIVSPTWDAAVRNTFGVEIETAGLSRERIARVVAGVVGEVVNYNTVVDHAGRKWRIVGDCSIRRCNGESAELVSPILRGEDDIALVGRVAEALKAAGAHCSTQWGAAVHVHVGAAEHDEKSLLRLFKIVVARQDLLCCAVGVDAGRDGHYCARFDLRQAKEFASVASKVTSMDAVKRTWYGVFSNCLDGSYQHYDDSRYHVLNLHAVFSKGTVEFRLFQWQDSSDELCGEDIRAWIMLCLALNQVSLQNKKASMNTPKADKENPAFAMRTWLVNGLGFNGAQFGFVRKVLGRRLGGNAAWRRVGGAYGCRDKAVPVVRRTQECCVKDTAC